MKLAFSSNAFRAHSIEETIGILAGIGYDGVELMCDAPHAWPAWTRRVRAIEPPGRASRSATMPPSRPVRLASVRPTVSSIGHFRNGRP